MDDLTSRTDLLQQHDPTPVEWVNRDSTSPVLLLCEHAGQAIPAQLAALGLPAGAIDLHIGWDIGALRLTSISSLVRNEIARTEDTDGGAAAIADVHIDATTRQFSQEFRLASTA